MPNWVDGVIVALLAIGASVLVGILGYLVDKNEGKSEGDQRDQDKSEQDKTSEPAAHKAEANRV
jgi:hypothetical protein